MDYSTGPAPTPDHIRARWDYATFCRVVMKDSETGQRWQLQDFHSEWAQLSGKIIDPPAEDERRSDPDLVAWRRRWRKAPWRHSRLVILAPIEHGKSEQRCIALPLWLIGIDPALRIAIISDTAGQARGFLGTVKQYIRTDPDYRMVFPWVVPETREGRHGYWRDEAIVVERPNISKDPTLQARGLGEAFQGARLDVILGDDIQDFDDTLTQYQRDKTVRWWSASVATRRTKNGHISLTATSWTLDDLAHTLVQKQGYHGVWYSVEAEDEGRPVVVDGKQIGVRRLARWPERWPSERRTDKRDELGQLEFDRQLRNLALSESMNIFSEVAIANVKVLGKAEGLQYWPWAYRQGEVQGQTYTSKMQPRIVGLDLATRKGEEHDLTCFFCIALDAQGRRHVVSILAGRLEGPDILRVLLGVQRLFVPDLVMVENNAAQVYIEQLAGDEAVMKALGATQDVVAGMNIVGYTTGKQKADPTLGVRSLSVEFEAGKWLAPAHTEVDRWLSEARVFDPSAHTGDRLMASWLAKEGVRMFYETRRPAWTTRRL